jgi:hypothetical protein
LATAGSGCDIDFAEYTNVAPIIGALVSSKMATLAELQTVYGCEDAYDLLEILSVDNFNKSLINKRNQNANDY